MVRGRWIVLSVAASVLIAVPLVAWAQDRGGPETTAVDTPADQRDDATEAPRPDDAGPPWAEEGAQPPYGPPPWAGRDGDEEGERPGRGGPPWAEEGAQPPYGPPPWAGPKGERGERPGDDGERPGRGGPPWTRDEG
jgi:hypothetical protein